PRARGPSTPVVRRPRSSPRKRCPPGPSPAQASPRCASGPRPPAPAHSPEAVLRTAMAPPQMDVRALPSRAVVVSVMFATMWDTNADRKRVVLGSIFWTLSLVGYGIIQPIVAAAWPSGYSFTDHAISDLGNTECGMFPNLANGEIYV